jgi:hypothetical protein
MNFKTSHTPSSTSEEKPCSFFAAYLKDTALVLTLVTAIMVFWGYQFYAGYYGYYGVDVSLFTPPTFDYLIVAAPPLISWLVIAVLFFPLKSILKGLIRPKWRERFFTLPLGTPASVKKWMRLSSISVAVLVPFLLTGTAMGYLGIVIARTQGDMKRPVIFSSEPDIAKGKQLYFLGYRNGRYLSYFRTDAEHTASLVVLKDDKLDWLFFPGQERTKPQGLTPVSVASSGVKPPSKP